MPEGQDSDYQPDSASLKNESGDSKHRYRDILLGGFVLVIFEVWNHIGAPRPQKEQENSNDRLIAAATEKIAKYTWWLVKITFASVITAIFSGYILLSQLSESKTDFAFIHRPHFRIRFADIEHSGGTIFNEGKPVVGTIEILNNGQSQANILDSDIEVYWSKNGLPMTPTFPQTEAGENQFACGPKKQGVKCAILPGNKEQGSFGSKKSLGPEATDIESGLEGWKIYLLGSISYSGAGDDDYVRHFDFAEVYDPVRRRFFPETDDPDYAHDPDKP